jgi:hypothetical protein
LTRRNNRKEAKESGREGGREGRREGGRAGVLGDIVPGLCLQALNVRGREALRLLVLKRLVLHHAVPGGEHPVDILREGGRERGRERGREGGREGGEA